MTRETEPPVLLQRLHVAWMRSGLRTVATIVTYLLATEKARLWPPDFYPFFYEETETAQQFREHCHTVLIKDKISKVSPVWETLDVRRDHKGQSKISLSTYKEISHNTYGSALPP